MSVDRRCYVGTAWLEELIVKALVGTDYEAHRWHCWRRDGGQPSSNGLLCRSTWASGGDVGAPEEWRPSPPPPRQFSSLRRRARCHSHSVIRECDTSRSPCTTSGPRPKNDSMDPEPLCTAFFASFFTVFSNFFPDFFSFSLSFFLSLFLSFYKAVEMASDFVPATHPEPCQGGTLPSGLGERPDAVFKLSRIYVGHIANNRPIAHGGQCDVLQSRMH